jgi:hypothetical protein
MSKQSFVLGYHVYAVSVDNICILICDNICMWICEV